jgi:subtilisin family serine protease
MTGSGITVAVIDTGINLSDFDKSRIMEFKDFINSYPTPYDDNGHGSKIAKIIGGSKGTYGIAKDCKFVIIKAFDNSGKSNINLLNSSLQWVLQNYQKYNISIVNMSLGIESMNSDKHDLLNNLINEIASRGIVILAAAGNGENNDPVLAPSNNKNVICVGSIKEDKTGKPIVCSFSRGFNANDKSKPDLYVYGSNIAFWDKGQITDMVSGTSYSTAIASGIASLLKQKKLRVMKEDMQKIFTLKK